MRDFLMFIYEKFLRSVAQIPSNTVATWRNDVFPLTLWLLLAITIVMAILFYFFYNRLYSSYNSFGSWFRTFLLNGFLTGVVAFIIAYSAFSKAFKPVLTLSLWYAVINLLYGFLLFFVLSMIFKWFSTNGRKTPF
ncbi:hypothetical protein [Bernardetia sp. MNP-M8]|uniref:hypothetical protein n=1 Tax=Bernardetia sp. MNP-M8 TaxID=3127470 RepID=UPI0030D4D35E